MYSVIAVRHLHIGHTALAWASFGASHLGLLAPEPCVVFTGTVVYTVWGSARALTAGEPLWRACSDMGAANHLELLRDQAHEFGLLILLNRPLPLSEDGCWVRGW